ncbi:MAG: adenylate/guanylate cyclase domain-containing protein [Pseudomonadota bacterium]|nr:adenylate/guanylate cyclase domain-containing protein [Pseudomonadota bacterium]
MKTVEIEREVACTAPPETLWPLLADTARLNRIVGMAPLELTPIEGAGSERYRVRTKLDGFPAEYDEEPFEWHSPDSFVVRRNMTQGVLHSLVMGLEVHPGEGGGSRVVWRLVFTVRLALLAPITRLVGEWRMNTVLAATRAFDASILAPPVPTAPGPVSEGFTRATDALVAVVGADEQALARRLGAWVAVAPDIDVMHIRPYELADQWGEPRDRLLAVCLEAVVVGLLQMHWDLICPSCRTGASRVEHLYDLTANGHCTFCDIGFEVPLDRSVEAIFQPAAALRLVEPRPYCTGGPSSTPHVLAQAHLARDGEARFRAPAEGRYRVFVRGGATAEIVVVADGATEVTLEATPVLTPASARVAPGATIVVRQVGGSARHAKLEHVAWAERAATAHKLSLQPRFRRTFSGEVLGPGRQLRVARVALLFSDLSASTALYSRVGDAPAFRLVQDHFELLREKIAAEGGVVVKTIGDAVMAAFEDEGAALRAGIAMQTAWDAFREPRPDSTDTMLKVGVHVGPAYVVTANGVLDYFGQTVNVAARLQGAAHEREIVVTDELAARAEAAGWLAGARVSEHFDAVLKGLDHPVKAARLVVG